MLDDVVMAEKMYYSLLIPKVAFESKLQAKVPQYQIAAVAAAAAAENSFASLEQAASSSDH